MAQLTWKEAKELVEIALACDFTTQDIVKELRRHTNRDLIASLDMVFTLLAVADHPLAEARYESMREYFSRLRDRPSWPVARMKLQYLIPLSEVL